MLIKISELKGASLDWAVGVSWNLEISIGKFGPFFGNGYVYPSYRSIKFAPSTDVKMCWTLLEKLVTKFQRLDDGSYSATIGDHTLNGQTIGEAICRVYVKYRNLTDEIDVPEELL